LISSGLKVYIQKWFVVSLLLNSAEDIRSIALLPGEGT